MPRPTKFTDEQMKQIRDLKKAGKSVKDIAQALNVKPHHITYALRPKGSGKKSKRGRGKAVKVSSFAQLKAELEIARAKVAELEKALMAKADAMAKVIEKIQKSAQV